MTDDNLFNWGEAHARNSDPNTSHEAAHEMAGEKANRLEKIVRDAIWSRPDGATNHDIVAITGLSWNTVTPRVRPLARKGLIINTGQTRIGPTNRRCIVWAKP